MLWWKSSKFLLSLSKPRVDFSSNFQFSLSLQCHDIYICANFLDFLVLGSKFNKFFSYLKKKKNLQIFHYSSVSWDITPLYLFSWNFIYFQQKKPIKVQIWWNFTWAVESLKFCTVVGSFCKNQIKFQLKKYRRLISHGIEEWCKV